MYKIECRRIVDREDDEGFKTVYDVIGADGEMVYTGVSWDVAERYVEQGDGDGDWGFNVSQI